MKSRKGIILLEALLALLLLSTLAAGVFRWQERGWQRSIRAPSEAGWKKQDFLPWISW